MIRSITGYGAGNGPIIAMHEGFEGIAAWNGFLSGADRLALDQHPYLAFQATQNNNTWAQNVSILLAHLGLSSVLDRS
jgi:glucan 1,3-beta-glucosidase